MLLIYFFVIALYALGWFNIKQHQSEKDFGMLKVTILIAVRNEEENISTLIDNISTQSYPKELIELIIINDHSDDETVNIIHESKKKIKLLHNEKSETGKKAAIVKGLDASAGDLVLITDGDCQMGNEWISEFVSFYQENSSLIISGPVIFHPLEDWFDKIQALEFNSLTGSGAGSMGIKHPVMCNAANMALSKKIIDRVRDVNSDKFTSGDDIFMLLNAKKIDSSLIHYLKSKKAMVKTQPAKNPKQFFLQRLRWTSKSRGYKDFDILFTAIVVATTNIMLAAILVASIFNPALFKCYLKGLIMKSLADLLILIPFSHFVKQKQLLLIFPFVQFFYPIYISMLSLTGNFIKFEWKKRKYKK